MTAEKRKTKPKPRGVTSSGWRKISDPEDLEKCIVTMLNKILMHDQPLDHAGRFASLANSWINARRLRLDSEEIQSLKERIIRLEEQAKTKETGARAREREVPEIDG